MRIFYSFTIPLKPGDTSRILSAEPWKWVLGDSFTFFPWTICSSGFELLALPSWGFMGSLTLLYSSNFQLSTALSFKFNKGISDVLGNSHPSFVLQVSLVFKCLLLSNGCSAKREFTLQLSVQIISPADASPSQTPFAHCYSSLLKLFSLFKITSSNFINTISKHTFSWRRSW